MSFVDVKLVALAALKLRTLFVALGTPLGVQFAGLFQFAPAAPVQSRAAGAVRSSKYSSLTGEKAGRLRTTACDWLLTTFRTVAGEMNRSGAPLQIQSDDNYQFTIANAAMVGQLLKLENGIRQLLVEVGWPRIPGHGFIRGGGIALGRLRHVGIKSASEQIRLVTSPDGSPRWLVEDKREPDAEIHEANIRHHIEVLLDSSRVDEIR